MVGYSPQRPDQHLGEAGIALQQILIDRRHSRDQHGLRISGAQGADRRRGEEAIADVVAVQEQDALKRHRVCLLRLSDVRLRRAPSFPGRAMTPSVMDPEPLGRVGAHLRLDQRGQMRRQ